MTKDQKIAKLGKVITDRATVLLGKDKITPESPGIPWHQFRTEVHRIQV